jgi:hypothetical protein
LQHIDFPLPRKHKAALFIAIETTPLTTTAALTPTMHRRARRDPPLADHRLKFSGTE